MLTIGDYVASFLFAVCVTVMCTVASAAIVGTIGSAIFFMVHS